MWSTASWRNRNRRCSGAVSSSYCRSVHDHSTNPAARTARSLPPPGRRGPGTGRLQLGPLGVAERLPMAQPQRPHRLAEHPHQQPQRATRQTSTIRPMQPPNTKVHSMAVIPCSSPRKAPSMAISFTSPPPTLNNTKQDNMTRPQAASPSRLSRRGIQPRSPAEPLLAKPTGGQRERSGRTKAQCRQDAGVGGPVVDLVPAEVGHGGRQHQAQLTGSWPASAFGPAASTATHRPAVFGSV